MVVFGGGGWEYSLVSGYVLRRRKKGGEGGIGVSSSVRVREGAGKVTGVG